MIAVGVQSVAYHARTHRPNVHTLPHRIARRNPSSRASSAASPPPMQQGESLFVLKGNPKNEIASFRAFRVANPCNLKLDLILAEKATLHQPLKRCSQATRSCGQRLSHCPREVIAHTMHVARMMTMVECGLRIVPGCFNERLAFQRPFWFPRRGLLSFGMQHHAHNLGCRDWAFCRC